MHALELKEFFGKLVISQKLEEISNVVKRTFYQYKKKHISLKAQFHILTISRTVYERVKDIIQSINKIIKFSRYKKIEQNYKHLDFITFALQL